MFRSACLGEDGTREKTDKAMIAHMGARSGIRESVCHGSGRLDGKILDRKAARCAKSAVVIRTRVRARVEHVDGGIGAGGEGANMGATKAAESAGENGVLQLVDC